MRMFALIPAVLALLAAPLLAQNKDLPAPPKPPKWLKKELGDKLPPPVAEKVQPKEAGPQPGGPKEAQPPRHGYRPVRVRINTPYFRLNLGINEGGPENKAVEVDVNVAGKQDPEKKDAGKKDAGKKDMAPGKPLADNWRYHRHNGRWWYWTPSERWAVWDDNRWIEITKEMLESGELRLGTPDRGSVRVKVGDLPKLKIGF